MTSIEQVNGHLGTATRSCKWMSIVVHIDDAGFVQMERVTSAFPYDRVGEARRLIADDLQRLKNERT